MQLHIVMYRSFVVLNVNCKSDRTLLSPVMRSSGQLLLTSTIVSRPLCIHQCGARLLCCASLVKLCYTSFWRLSLYGYSPSSFLSSFIRNSYSTMYPFSFLLYPPRLPVSLLECRRIRARLFPLRRPRLRRPVVPRPAPYDLLVPSLV